MAFLDAVRSGEKNYLPDFEISISKKKYDLKLFYTITSGQFNISGFQNKNLRQKLPDKSCFQISRMLKRLRTHGMIKKIGHTYKYYLTKLGRKIIITALKMKELFLVPQLAKM